MISYADHWLESVPMPPDPVPAAAPGGSVSTPEGAGAALGKEPRTPPGGRRRRKPGGRTKQVNVKVSLEEYEQLSARAAEVGVSVPRFLVESSLGGGVSPSERRAWIASFLAARHQVAGAVNNLNQLARWANTNEAYPPGADRTAEALAEVLEQLGDVLERAEL